MVHHQLDRLFTPTRARRVGSTSTSSIPILIVVFCVIVIEISGSSRRDTIRAGVNQGKHNEVLAEGLNGVPDNCDIAAVGADEGSIRTRREHFGQAVLAEAMATLKLFKQEISLGGISKLVRTYPQFLNSNPEKTLLPKLEFSTSLGVSEEDLATTLGNEPILLARSLEKQILPTYNFLRSMISGGKIASVFRHCTRIFLEGHSKNVEPNIGILRESGMPQSCISLMVAHFTLALMQNRKKFAQVVGEVKQMGFDMEKSMSVMAIKALSSANSKSIWTRNCEVYKRWGWSEDDVLSAFKRHPVCMTRSEKKIMQVMEFVVNKMGLSSQMIVKAPVIMGYS
ncbi:hypothetical protein ACFX1X_028682 [Malus domestica]|uniref:uncharacterized protein n=1 Tax=Malus domestica TaxID=3750 RepID=UPI0010AA8F0A|nr:uncharacterized protein LOC103434683 [Malus domestica]